MTDFSVNATPKYLFDCLVDMIETGSVATPSIDEVWESFRIAHEADKIIRGAK